MCHYGRRWSAKGQAAALGHKAAAPRTGGRVRWYDSVRAKEEMGDEGSLLYTHLESPPLNRVEKENVSQFFVVETTVLKLSLIHGA